MPPARRAGSEPEAKGFRFGWELAGEIRSGAFRVIGVRVPRDVLELLLALDVSSLGARGPEPLPDDVRLEAGQGTDTNHWQARPD